MPLDKALSLTCDRPTNAYGPKKSNPRVNPGTVASVSILLLAKSSTPIDPFPDSRIHSLPSCHRGECGMLNPRQMISPDSTSIKIPPLALFFLHPAGESVSPSAVT